MALTVRQAADRLNITEEDVQAALDRGDLQRPLTKAHVDAAAFAEWSTEPSERMVRARERKQFEDAHHDAARSLGVPPQTLMTALERGEIDLPEWTDNVHQIPDLLANQPRWLTYARLAVAAGYPERAATLDGIDDEDTWAVMRTMAALLKPSL